MPVIQSSAHDIGAITVTLAIFDLDNTLLAGDSDHAWGEFLCQKGYVDSEEYRVRNDGFYQDYCRGELDIFAYQEFALKPLVGREVEELEAWRVEFMESVIEGLWLPKAEALLQRHLDRGDTLVIITATNRFVTEPIAKKLRVHDLIATEPELLDGRYTGRLTGIPCYQEGKVKRLAVWMEQHAENLKGSTFYSDSINDLALLEHVEVPVAVDPDEKLRKIATSRNWQIISLR